MKRCGVILLCLGCLGGLGCLAGCGREHPGIQTFERQWHDAMNRRRYERLYDLLDARSQRRIDVELEKLRGLGENEQSFVLDHLGGEQLSSLADLEPDRYFARWWHKATSGRRPKMSVEDHDDGNGYMMLSFDDGPKLRVRLTVQSRRWVWHLPPQDLDADAPTPADRLTRSATDLD